MPNEVPRQLFVTGTDTGIGKTLVCAILMVGLQGTYWKPVQSGLEGPTDTEWVREVTGLPQSHFLPETYRLRQPLSPHASAAADGLRIELEAFHLPEVTGHLIVEGAGGIMVPLNDRHFMLDLMRKLNLPILLVARSELGTINHTLLSLEQLRRHGLDVFGVVMNGTRNPGNREAIEYYGKVNVCAEIEPLPQINPQSLRQALLDCGSLTATSQTRYWHHSPVHVFRPNSLYIVTASTRNRAHIFSNEERLRTLRDALFEVTESYGWQLQAWAVFPNHYHFVARSPDDGTTLRRLIQRLHSRTARKVNILDEKPGRQVWFQYWDNCLTYEKSYLARLNYVHQNAVKHGFVAKAEDYPFCSAGWFKNNPDPAFRRKLERFRYDRVNVPDDF